MNGLDIILQELYISSKDKIQDLKLENIFLIHEWSPTDMQYAFYTEADIRKIYKSFGHPCINSTEWLIKRACQGSLDSETRDTIRLKADECKSCEVYAKAQKRFKLKTTEKRLKIPINALRESYVGVDSWWRKRSQTIVYFEYAVVSGV